MPTPAEELAAYNIIRAAQIAAWPAIPSLLTVAQHRTAKELNALDFPPSFDPAVLDTNYAFSTRCQPGVFGQWSRTADADGSMIYVRGANGNSTMQSYQRWADDLAIATSTHVFNLNYRPAPEWDCPAPVDDILRAMAWLDSHGHPVSRMVLAGDSFGPAPILAAMLARRDAGLPLPAGAYFLCPKTDYSGDTITVGPFDPDPDTCRSFDCFDGYFETVPRTDVRASPYLFDLDGLPPILIHSSDGDTLNPAAIALRDKLILAGNDCTYREWDTVPHVWPTYGTAFAYSLEAATEAGTWIRDKLS